MIQDNRILRKLIPYLMKLFHQYKNRRRNDQGLGRNYTAKALILSEFSDRYSNTIRSFMPAFIVPNYGELLRPRPTLRMSAAIFSKLFAMPVTLRDVLHHYHVIRAVKTGST